MKIRSDWTLNKKSGNESNGETILQL